MYTVLIVSLPLTTKQIHEQLDNGWTLAHVLPWESKIYFYFKRTIEI